MVVLRTGVLEDLDQLIQLHANAVTAGYRNIFPIDSKPPTAQFLAAAWRTMLASSDIDVIVAEEAELIVGSVALAPEVSVTSGLLMKRLHVLPARWNRGIGGELHDKALTTARGRGANEVNLWVLEENHRARNMYERRGWQLCEPRRICANEVPTVLDVLYERHL